MLDRQQCPQIADQPSFFDFYHSAPSDSPKRPRPNPPPQAARTSRSNLGATLDSGGSGGGGAADTMPWRTPAVKYRYSSNLNLLPEPAT